MGDIANAGNLLACVQLCHKTEAEEKREGFFSHQCTSWNKMVLSEKCLSTGSVNAVFHSRFFKRVQLIFLVEISH